MPINIGWDERSEPQPTRLQQNRTILMVKNSRPTMRSARVHASNARRNKLISKNVRMNIRRAIENNIATALFTVAVAGFSAGWFSYSAVQNASGLESIPGYSLRELEKRASLGKEDLILANKLLNEKIDELNEHIDHMHHVMLSNRYDGNVIKISNVRLDPPSPAKLKVGSTITIKFSYEVGKGEKVDLLVRAGRLSSSKSHGIYYEGLTGSGEAKIKLAVQNAGDVNEIIFLRNSTNDDIAWEKKMEEILRRDSPNQIPQGNVRIRSTLWPVFQAYVNYEITGK